MYDLIGDIHGHIQPLEALLRKMGYVQTEGIYRHPNRKALFIGDYIDRGPAIREVLQLVKGMVDAGAAIALMGNHEYNALAWHTPDRKGDYLRSHSEKHYCQHAETLRQFAGFENDWQAYINWFYTLPLFVELDGFRAVHACWDDAHIQWLKANNLQLLTPDFLRAAHNRGSQEHLVIEETLKGKEVDIPAEFVWNDKDGNPRTTNRTQWWADPRAQFIWGEFLFNCPEAMADVVIPANQNFYVYPLDAPPVFVGHYWLTGAAPVIQRSNVVCLDYSIAKGGSLVAYRWDGGLIREESFVVQG